MTARDTRDLRIAHATLFDAAAEARAFVSGRPKSQERAELIGALYPAQEAGAGFRCLLDHPLKADRRRGLVCPTCDP